MSQRQGTQHINTLYAAVSTLSFHLLPLIRLDSGSALSVTRLFRGIAGDGLPVILVLHQPRQEIFDLVDQLVLLVSKVLQRLPCGSQGALVNTGKGWKNSVCWPSIGSGAIF